MGTRVSKSGHRTGLESGHRRGKNLDAGGKNLDALFIFNGVSSMSYHKQEKISQTPTPQDCGPDAADFWFCVPKKKRRRQTTEKAKTISADGLPRHLHITTDQLTDANELETLYNQYQGDVNHFDFLALACRAVRKGSNPPALFRHLLTNEATDHLTNLDDEMVMDLLRRMYEQPSRSKLVRQTVGEVQDRLRAAPLPTPQERYQKQQELLEALAQFAREEDP